MKKLALCFILILGIAASGCDGGASGGSKSSGTTAGANQEDGLNGLNLETYNGNSNGDSFTAPDTVDNTVPDFAGDTIPLVLDTVGDSVPDINNISEVPEPGSLILLGSGLMGFALYRLRSLKK